MKTTVKQYLDDLYDKGRRCFDDLHDDEKNVLSGLITIEEKNDDIFSDGVNFEALPTLLAKMAVNDYTSYKEAFLKACLENLVDMNKYRIDELFESFGIEMRAANEENIRIERSETQRLLHSL